MPNRPPVTMQHYQGRIAILTLNNPERLNALTPGDHAKKTMFARRCLAA